jgi:hypothetical protein
MLGKRGTMWEGGEGGGAVQLNKRQNGFYREKVFTYPRGDNHIVYSTIAEPLPRFTQLLQLQLPKFTQLLPLPLSMFTQMLLLPLLRFTQLL